jgi:hypothetical protein
MALEIDLFPKSKSELLAEWMKKRQIFSSVDLAHYSLENYYLRAPRTARDFCREGKIRRLTDWEKVTRGLVIKGRKNIAWYVWEGA